MYQNYVNYLRCAPFLFFIFFGAAAQPAAMPAKVKLTTLSIPSGDSSLPFTRNPTVKSSSVITAADKRHAYNLPVFALLPAKSPAVNADKNETAALTYASVSFPASTLFIITAPKKSSAGAEISQPLIAAGIKPASAYNDFCIEYKKSPLRNKFS